VKETTKRHIFRLISGLIGVVSAPAAIETTAIVWLMVEEEEKAVVGDLSYVGLYRRMVDALLAQRSLGMAIFDLGDLLADVKETIYADSVHFHREYDGDSLGYRLMAKRVAADVAQAWGLKRKPETSR
jgi:hypothetical protein